ncbi:MAG: phosphoserine phosphatase SerB [Acidimicrobiia bacterium]|nr:phosphoserine phosphatase SerB [Acidimicrobiia bacterium]MYC57985.1 phosphoserine phosphatase SerB [Acidimicrobiia bacterium]MYG94673.1 phosphoserine phosphatase SerB [Acidimicrobiia bacterium]MYI31066.1 phosphoserine phosphatase SerB [Acidimicrobiia bacterium]
MEVAAANSQVILLRVSGPDRPGLFAGLLRVLTACNAHIQDVEQVVIRRQLTLCLVLEVPPGQDLLKDLLLFGWEQRVTVDFDVVDPTPTTHPSAHAVTILGRELSPAMLAATATAIADGKGNIRRIVRLSRYPIYSYELLVEGGDEVTIRQNLLAVAGANSGFDVAIQREGLARRAKRVAVLDVDSTLIQDEIIDLLAAEAGCVDKCRMLTEQAVRGEIDFETALVERVRLLAGLEEPDLERAWDQVTLTPGARTFLTTLKRLGFVVGIVSGGFTRFCNRLKEQFNLDHAHANVLEMVDGKLTGKLQGPIVDRARKAELLKQIAASEGVSPEQVVAVGDGANDIDMLAVAGLGIAFNAKPKVREAVETSVNVPHLDAILFLLGVSREELEAEGI